MNADSIMVESAMTLWKSTVSRANKIFADLSEEDAEEPVAPGRNRVVYLLGHLTAVHDRMIPLLRLGERVHPEMDASFVLTRIAPSAIFRRSRTSRTVGRM